MGIPLNSTDQRQHHLFVQFSELWKECVNKVMANVKALVCNVQQL